MSVAIEVALVFRSRAVVMRLLWVGLVVAVHTGVRTGNGKSSDWSMVGKWWPLARGIKYFY